MGVVYRKFVYPTYHWFKRDGVNRAVKELDRNQWLSNEAVLAIQRKKLGELLHFAGKNVPYYRSVFDTLGVVTGSELEEKEFQRIPILTKGTIRKEQQNLVSEDLSGNKLFSNSTSGSTGETLRFYTDLRSTAYRKAAGIRSHTVTGWRLGDRSASLWGAPMDEKRATKTRGWIHGRITGKLFLSSFDLSNSRMDEYIRKLHAFKPIELFAYPGPLEQFAMHCQKQKAVFPSLKGIVTSAETLWPHQREIIESAFATRIYNQYGCREVSQIATECREHNGLHISVDRVLIEVVDDQYRPCPPGEAGRILVTDLDNYGMPLIRYDIGDMGVMADNRPCGCGRGLPRMAQVLGRTLDIVHTPDGRRIGGTFWTLLLRSRPGFRQFQVIQDKIEGVSIAYVRDSEFDPGVLDHFRVKIKDYCGHNFNVDFVETESIDLTKSGKQRLIVSSLQSENKTETRAAG